MLPLIVLIFLLLLEIIQYCVFPYQQGCQNRSTGRRRTSTTVQGETIQRNSSRSVPLDIMSKITSKNLHYDDSLPPFLARLRANNNAGDGRHEYTVARPKKARTAEDEAEDEPVYFDEGSGETLTKSEWEAREAGSENQGEGKDGEKAEAGEESAAKGDAGKESKEEDEFHGRRDRSRKLPKLYARWRGDFAEIPFSPRTGRSRPESCRSSFVCFRSCSSQGCCCLWSCRLVRRSG